MKRFFAIILTLALILTMIPLALNAAAADETAVTVSVDGVNHTAHIGDVKDQSRIASPNLKARYFIRKAV